MLFISKKKKFLKLGDRRNQFWLEIAHVDYGSDVLQDFGEIKTNLQLLRPNKNLPYSSIC